MRINNCNIIFLCTLASILSFACSNRSKDNEIKTLSIEEKVTSETWCYAETLSEDTNVITRFKFEGDGKSSFSKENTTSRERILIANKMQPAIYEFENTINWEMYGKDKSLWSDRFSVQLVEDNISVYNSEVKNQKRIISRISKINTNIIDSEDSFLPKSYINILFRPILSSEVKTISAYPCRNYSQAIASLQEPKKPMLELNLYLQQEVWSASHSHISPDEDIFEKAMLLSFPINLETSNTTGKLTKTSWCSWHQLDRTTTMLDVISFSSGTYSKVSYFSTVSDSIDFLSKFWESKVSEAPRYIIDSIENGVIKSSGAITIGDTKIKTSSLFYVIKDSLGTNVLVEGNPYNPDSSIFLFSSYYFPCADERPLKIDPYFKKYLPNIIQIQQSNTER